MSKIIHQKVSRKLFLRVELICDICDKKEVIDLLPDKDGDIGGIYSNSSIKKFGWYSPNWHINCCSEKCLRKWEKDYVERNVQYTLNEK